MVNCSFIGWDIGGAHLKMAGLNVNGDVLIVEQLATPLWNGLDTLELAFKYISETFVIGQVRHVITMTAELADIFPDREHGVVSILKQFNIEFSNNPILIYAGIDGLVNYDEAGDYISQIASANWHATALYSAMNFHNGILVDIGSTTTDIIPFSDSMVCQQGWTDYERLRNYELVYTGIVRTPVMAVVQRVPFRGYEQNISSELFATMADVYRLTGELLEHQDLMDTADGKGKSKHESAQRLARMVGLDLNGDGPLMEWIELAGYIADQQLAMIRTSFLKVADRTPAGAIIGAGSGRFLARKLAQQANYPYIDFIDQLQVAERARLKCADCATAIAVAELARLAFEQ